MRQSTWRGRPFGLAILPAIAVLILGTALSARAQREPAKPDAASLRLTLPAGASVSLNGVNQGARTSYEFRPFAPGAWGEYKLQARLRNGSEAKRSLILKGGWSVRLPIEEDAPHRPELVLQTGHSVSVSYVAISPDGRWVATSDRVGAIILWETATGRKLREYHGVGNAVSRLLFSPDAGKLFDGRSVWETATGRLLYTLQGNAFLTRSAVFSPDGRRLFTGSYDCVKEWDAETGKMLRTLDWSDPSKPAGGMERNNVEHSAFSPDGRTVLAYTINHEITLRDTERWEKLWTLKDIDRCFQVAFSPDGHKILTASNKVLDVRDAANGTILRSFAIAADSLCDGAGFSPDGRKVVVCHSAYKKERDPKNPSSDDITIGDLETGEKQQWNVHPPDQRFPYAISEIALHPGGQMIVTGSAGGFASLRDLATGRIIRNFEGSNEWVRALAVAPDGRGLITATGPAVFWDLTAGKPVHSFPSRRGPVTSVSFRADSRQILTGSDLGEVALWDPETGQKLRELEGHEYRDFQGKLVEGTKHNVSSVALSPDGRLAVTGSGDWTAILWDVETGRKLFTFKTFGGVQAVAFSPDGRRVLVGSSKGGGTPDDRLLLLFDAKTGERLRDWRAQPYGVLAVALSPDGRRLLSGGSGGDPAILWNADTGAAILPFRGHGAAASRYFTLAEGFVVATNVSAVAFSPDGRWVLTGSWDKTAMLWDATTGRPLRTFRGHTEGLDAVAFLRDGRRIVTASKDGTTRLWDIATGDELGRILTLNGGDDWLVCTPEGLFDGSEGGRQQVAYRVGGGLNVVPVDRFFQDFYRPGLLAELIRGEQPRPEIELGKSRPPLVRIVSPRPGSIIEEDSVNIDVEIVDQGGNIRGPQLFQNGVRVLAPGETQRQGKILRRRFVVELVEGSNKFEVRDASGDGSQDSDPATLLLRREKPLNKGDLYVLAVGINRYAQEWMDLQFAAADAKAIAAVFRQRGRALYRNTNVVELLDGQATRAAIRGALREIARTASAQDTLVVFLAGHGTMVEQRFYFIPHDYRNDPTVPMSESIRRQGLPAEVLADDMSAVKALRRLMVLDACHSGGALTAGRTRDPFAMRGAIERISRSQGLFTIAATVAGDEAHEIPELGHGVLSYALLGALGAAEQGPLKGQSMHPDNPERVANVIEWFSYAAGQLPRLTRRYLGREQDAVTRNEGVSFPVLPVEPQ